MNTPRAKILPLSHSSLCIASAFLLALTSVVTVPAQGEPPSIEAVFTSSKPILDARIDPGEWDSAEPSIIEHLLRAPEGSKPAPHYQFRLLWDAEALYVLFETNLTNWPGGTSGFGGNNNLNFYIDPDNDDEPNGNGGNLFDGYHPVIYPDIGKTSRFDRSFDPGFRSAFHEASINANFGGSNWPAGSSQEEGVAIDYVSEVGANGGVIELCFPWAIFDSEAGTDMEIYHPDPPEVGDSWFLNICMISALGDLPTWSWNTGQFFAERPHGVITFVADPVRAPLFVSHDAVADTVTLSWDSQPFKLYNLRSETDPAVGLPVSWPIFGGHENVVATPPRNSVTFPLDGEPTRLFAVEEFPAPPEIIFSADFEDGGTGWQTDSTGEAGTVWEIGTSTLYEAHGGLNFAGTNLNGEFEMDANVVLRSPAIDLSQVPPEIGATLQYHQIVDTDGIGDFGTVTILDATDDTILAVLDDFVSDFDLSWKSESYSLPVEALGKTVVIEFRFQSDNIETFTGWYIDEVELTMP